jgi:hypothetical protein
LERTRAQCASHDTWLAAEVFRPTSLDWRWLEIVDRIEVIKPRRH